VFLAQNEGEIKRWLLYLCPEVSSPEVLRGDIEFNVTVEREQLSGELGPCS
jgi:hypothetical protein